MTDIGSRYYAAAVAEGMLQQEHMLMQESIVIRWVELHNKRMELARQAYSYQINGSVPEGPDRIKWLEFERQQADTLIAEKAIERELDDTGLVLRILTADQLYRRDFWGINLDVALYVFKRDALQVQRRGETRSGK